MYFEDMYSEFLRHIQLFYCISRCNHTLNQLIHKLLLCSGQNNTKYHTKRHACRTANLQKSTTLIQICRISRTLLQDDFASIHLRKNDNRIMYCNNQEMDTKMDTTCPHCVFCSLMRLQVLQYYVNILYYLICTIELM